MVVVPSPFGKMDTRLEVASESGRAVDAIRLGKVYGDTVVAAQNISLYANVGEIVGLVGPNGAGKSTTLKMLATLIRPTEGSATICGHSISDRHRVRSMMGVALQDVGLDPLMTGQEHLKIQAALCGLPFHRVRNQAAKLVERFSLESYMGRYVGAYSGGTQRRLALVLALLTDPEVIIFDEPTAGLDPRARRDLWHIVTELKNTNRTIIFSTQYLEEADALCDRIYFIDRGSIVADGSPESLKRAIGEPTLHITLDRATGPLILDVHGALPIEISGTGSCDVSVKTGESRVGPTKILQAIEDRGMGVRGFKLVPPSLDDVFFHYTQRTLEPEPPEMTGMDLGTRAHRGGGKKWK